MQTLTIGVMAFILWLLLSGHYDNPLLLGLGVASSTLVALLGRRMAVAAHSPGPLYFSWRVLPFIPWLALQVILSNLTVARLILRPRLAISPTVVKIPLDLRTDLGRVTYANSITLTPGTVTIDLQADHLQVHALTQAGADELLQGEMGRRVQRLEA